MNPQLVITVSLPSLVAWIGWLIFSTIRRYKIAKLQADIQNKLLDKVSSSQELLAFAQTEPGKQMLASLKVEQVSPYGRIIGALQTGIIMAFVGIALLSLRHHVQGADEGFLVIGTLLTVLGLGFGTSSVASYYLSKSFGLLDPGRA
jgi:hypothetical protein